MKRRAELDAPFRGQRFDERPTNSPKAASWDTAKIFVRKNFITGSTARQEKFFRRKVTRTGYIYLAAAIVLELFGTTCMKLSDGFSQKIFAVGTLTFYGLCFYFFALSLKSVQLNIAYATWGGLGVVLAAVVAKLFFHESISTAGLIGIILIVVGVVLCNFFGVNH